MHPSLAFPVTRDLMPNRLIIRNAHRNRGLICRRRDISENLDFSNVLRCPGLEYFELPFRKQDSVIKLREVYHVAHMSDVYETGGTCVDKAPFLRPGV